MNSPLLLGKAQTPRAIRDEPFCWQSKAVRRLIRDSFDASHNVASALAVYDALTEIASDSQAERFVTTHSWIQHLSGASVSTIKKHLREFEVLGLVKIDTPPLRAPSTYTLFSIANDCPSIANHGLALASRAQGGPLATSEESINKLEETGEKGTSLFSDAIANRGAVSKTELQRRVESIFRRRESTAWSKSELKAWSDARTIIEDTTADEWSALEAFYAAEEYPNAPLFRRTDLERLVKNWQGEIGKAIRYRDGSNSGALMR